MDNCELQAPPGRLSGKEAAKLKPPLSQQVAEMLIALRQNPRRLGVRRLVDSRKKGWRARVGKLRILFLIDDEAQLVTVYDIDRRDKVYHKK
jgi:mRNA-degrading endonuclease RelE of RelBE toxin-antitoxin system